MSFLLLLIVILAIRSILPLAHLCLIGIGDFKARFYMKANNFKGDEHIALLDIVADYGWTQLAKKTISKLDFKDGIYNYFDLDFKTSKRLTRSVEF